MLEEIRTQPNKLTDEEIISEVKAGNIEYFSEIVRRYNQRMYRTAVSYGIFDDNCAEVIQLSYISAYENLSQFRGEAKFSTWLIRILINECLMMKRKTKRNQNLFQDDNVTVMSAEHLNPAKEFMDKETKKILETAIRKLPEKYKSVYILKEVEGLSVEEVSEALNISKVNVKVRTHRAKSILKSLLNEITDVSDLFEFGNERCDLVTNKVMDYIMDKTNTEIIS